MPGVFRAAARHTVAVLATCLLAACAGDSAGTDAAATSGEAAALPRLSCLPGALLSIELPLQEGYAYAHAGPRSGDNVGRCVLSLFGTRTLKSPLAFDRAYGTVFAYHEEDGTLDLRGLTPARLQLFRIGSTAAADVWLVRAEAGTELEPSHHDVLFSTGRQDGALVDHLLVGAKGMLYRRDYDIEAAQGFTIHEETGRGPEAGPGYRGRYRVLDDGRFELVEGRVLPTPPERP